MGLLEFFLKECAEVTFGFERKTFVIFKNQRTVSPLTYHGKACNDTFHIQDSCYTSEYLVIRVLKEFIIFMSSSQDF